MSVINDAQTNRVCALSITLTSYFCLNTASVLWMLACVGEVCEDQWCFVHTGSRRSKQLVLTEELFPYSE